VLRLSVAAVTAGLAAPLLSSTANAGEKPSWWYPTPRTGANVAADRAADRIAAAIRRPRIPRRSVDLTRFGGVGDGTTDNSAAFTAAIDALSRHGGGRLVVPAGRFLTGPIHLRSRIDLHLAKGATVAFTQDKSAYLPVVFTRWQGIEFMNYSPFIYAFGQQDVAITGSGTFDGQADATHWWDWKAPGDTDFPSLEAQANAGIPPEQRVFGEGWHFRPVFVQPYRCRRVLIEGVTFTNSPMWHLNPVLCQDVTVDGVTVQSTGPNTDGCNPESSDHVLIDDCSFNVGDDCIAIKAGRNTDGRRVDTPSTNLVIQRTSFAAGHGGITIGSEMTGGVQNVYGRDLTMDSPSLQSGHRLKTNSVRGGYIKNSNIYRVKVGTIAGPVLLIDFTYGEGDTGSYPPVVTGINLTDWTVDTCKQIWQAVGYPEDHIGTVSLTNVAVTTLTGTNVSNYIDALTLTNVTVAGVPITT
jgi:polygalacturonase